MRTLAWMFILIALAASQPATRMGALLRAAKAFLK